MTKSWSRRPKKCREALAEEQMLGPMLKEFAELGHWFDSAHGKCVYCGTPTIDLYEDGSYGEVRRCNPNVASGR